MSAEKKGNDGINFFEGKPGSSLSGKGGRYQGNTIPISAAGRDLLEEYSGIPAIEVHPHVLRVRDNAFEIWSYPCIGQVRFLDYTIPKHPYYGPVLKLLRSGGTFVDAGCCFGQDIRFLVHVERIPSTQLYGFDLEPAFIDFGYELFRDREKLGTTMLSGDVLADPASLASRDLAMIEGNMDVVHVAQVLHI